MAKYVHRWRHFSSDNHNRLYYFTTGFNSPWIAKRIREEMMANFPSIKFHVYNGKDITVEVREHILKTEAGVLIDIGAELIEIVNRYKLDYGNDESVHIRT